MRPLPDRRPTGPTGPTTWAEDAPTALIFTAPPPAPPPVAQRGALPSALGALGLGLALLGALPALPAAPPALPLSAPAAAPAALPIENDAAQRALRAAVLQPPIIERPVLWNAERERLAMLYFERHKGWPPGQDPKRALRMEPRVIVQHWTAGPTARSAYNTFRAPAQVRRRDRSESNALNLCSHFVVDRDGSIYRLMPEDRMGRHTIGLNHLAIGVENVGDGKRWPLTQAQVEANAALVRWLAAAYPLTHLIAHAEYRWLESHPYFVETDPGFRTGRIDPGPEFMGALRAAVADLGLQAPTRPERPHRRQRLSGRPSPHG
ncbi:MAG: N-acetylmuramoyl-L-alanine amidase [Deltaproteobacteria bacterium]|nr:N-acetylmuramoyl-L-alanine amidase [Deltaproteobacteria bacterium]